MFDEVVAVASGKEVKSEIAGFHDMAIFKQGVTLQAYSDTLIRFTMWHIDKWIENYPDYFKNNRKNDK